MDLASLFCMIGRHGPAVALAVILMVSVVAGFIIYRTVRGKRRKATAAADGADSKSEEREERDASVVQEPDPEELHRPAESTGKDPIFILAGRLLQSTGDNIHYKYKYTRPI